MKGATVHEIKSGDGKLDRKSETQLENLVKLVKPGRKAKIAGVDLERVEYTFTSPEGPKTNAEVIYRTLRKNPDFAVRVFDESGRVTVYRSKDAPLFFKDFPH